MALLAPYLIVGFDVDSADPNAAAIIANVRDGFPIAMVLPLGMDNLWSIEVPPSQMYTKFERVWQYLNNKDTEHNGALRWMVQLCKVADVAVGA